jgi:hypothetical protein
MIVARHGSGYGWSDWTCLWQTVVHCCNADIGLLQDHHGKDVSNIH